MADVKISQLTAASSANSAMEYEVNDSGTSKKVTGTQILAWVWSSLGALITGGAGKTTPVDADSLPLCDSAASNATKKLTWANLRAAIFVSDSAITAGFTATAVNDGTKSSGTYTPTPAGGNLKRAVNGGAHTLAAPSVSGDYTIIIQYTNNGSAGAITLSGFSKTSGTFTTTNGDDFLVFITKINGFIHANVVALQ